MRKTILAALASLSLVASVAAAPSATVNVGFDGLVRSGRSLHLRVELDNPGPAWSGRFRLEETIGDRASVTWEWPIEVPAQGKRVRFLSLAPAVLGLTGRSGARAGLVEEGELEELSLRFAPGGNRIFVVLTITDQGTGFSGVRDALDPPGPNQGQVEIKLPAIRPEEAPPHPASWEVVDAIVIDLAAADRIDARSWSAIQSRVVQGASLLVHGVGRLPELFPEEMVPGRPALVAGPGRWTEPTAEVEHSALSLDLAEGATRPDFEDEFLPWAATLRLGAGRVTVATVDLRNLRSPTARQAPLWGSLLGLTGFGGPEAIRPTASVAVRVSSHSLAMRSFANSSLVLLLGVAAALSLGALVVVRLRRQSEGLMRLAPLVGLVAALPLFGVGTVSRLVEDREPFVVEEHLAALGMTRTTTIVSPASSRERIGELPLDGWPPRLLPAGVGARRQAGLAFEGGSTPRARRLRPARTPGLSVLAESWAPAEGPFALETDGEGTTIVRNVSGRDLSDVQVLSGRSFAAIGDLAAGAAAPVQGFHLNVADSLSIHALGAAEGRLDGLAIAGVLRTTSSGILQRPASGVVVSWLEAAR